MKAGSLIRRKDNRVLLCHATTPNYTPKWYDGQWGLPFGAGGFFEKPWDTAARETKEEAGVDVRDLNCQRVFYKKDNHERYVFEFSGGDKIDKLECLSTVPFFGFPEMDAFGWFTPYQALCACEYRFKGLFETLLGKNEDWTCNILLR